MTKNRERADFFLRQLGKGFLFLIVIIGGYILVSRLFGFDLKEIMGPLYERPIIIYTIFWVSEVVFGIIPPEFFMIWSQRHGDLSLFVNNVTMLMVISYVAGVVGYWFGAYLNGTRAYTFLKKKIFGKFEEHFHHYGGFLVIVAAVTPIPFSGICMLVGSVRYPFTKFLLFAMARFVRFTVYAAIIWQTQVA
ncbi:MAG: VTT domain-containing protein [Cytophagales bacterium]|nr:VTT domain-containing protein [Cytophagales bacterium]